MTVSFLTPSVSRALGGIYEVERHLARSLDRSTSVSVKVVGLRDEYTERDLPEWRPLHPTVLPVKGPSAFGYSPELVDALLELDIDILHLHALWMYTSVAALRWRARTDRPHMITIHGMLDPWAVNNSRWKKQLAGWLYEHANLRKAACLQVFSEKEYEAVREYGIDTPVCIIPNGVQLPEEPVDRRAPWHPVIPETQNVLLFLGRIHPKKGLDKLLKAWKQEKQVQSGTVSDWMLAVVGWDDGGHEARLQKRVQDEAIHDVHFLGPMFGADKAAAFHHADAFVLPSYSEGLPMAVLEAWSYGLPVLMTAACNLSIGVEWGAAVETRPSSESLARDLSSLLQRSDCERAKMGRRGRELVKEHFTWRQVAKQMRSVYRWLINGGRPPGVVRFN